MTFALDLQRFADKMGKKADLLVGNIVNRVAIELDERSPIGDATYWKSPPPKGYVGGHFRNNWQLGIGTRPVGEVAGVDTSPKGANGGATTGRIMAEIPDQASGKVYFLSNNAPYARLLEDGHSPQAGPGYIVSGTVSKFQAIVAAEIAKLPQ